MHRDDLELRLTTSDQAGPIRNLWPLYLHDISAYNGRAPNRHGVLGDDPDLESWPDPGAWWSQPGVLFPYLARVGGIPAGFNLISSGPHVPTPGIDFVVHEFFMTHAFRGDGTAVQAARLGIERHRGTWEVVTYPNAARPIAFWRKTLPACASGEVLETVEEDHPFGPRVVFRFDNRGS
jgi:aminoglycoside 6'-N-acetyltransferase I